MSIFLQSILLHLMTFLVGLGFWSLTEYWVHHVLCHQRKNKIANKIHWDHHKMIGGIEKARLEVSAYGRNTSLYIAAMAVPILWLIFQLVLGKTHGFVFTLAFVVGYLHYEYVHWRIHCREPRNRHEARLRDHHFAHHYCDPKRYQSVTLPAIDHFFGTIPDAKKQTEHYEKVKTKKALNSENNLWAWIYQFTSEHREFPPSRDPSSV